MYKLLLSWRYLRTRYLALASIISVMLGVATLIVVNAIMGGFSTKLRDRVRGFQADITVGSRSIDGVPFPTRTPPPQPAEKQHFNLAPRPLTAERLEKVQKILGEKIEAVTPVLETVAMVQFQMDVFDRNGQFLGKSEPYTRPVQLIGIEPVSKSKTTDFAKFLLNEEHRRDPSKCFTLDETAQARYQWNQSLRSMWFDAYEAAEKAAQGAVTRSAKAVPRDGPPPLDEVEVPADVVRVYHAVVGYGFATRREPDAKAGDDAKDRFVLKPGDVITLSTLTKQLPAVDGSIHPPRPRSADFIISDIYKSEISDIDSNFIFVHINDLQDLRAMENHITGLQIKLKDYDRDVREALAVMHDPRHFDSQMFTVESWEQRQGPLLSAIAIERNLLNILLFLIIAVAGFGILAIFFMIVVEKTKDIGILKSLGASSRGVMGIFLSYGLALGLVGGGLGTALGVLITVKVNELEHFIARIRGTDVFPRDVYYFDKIPTELTAGDVLLVNLGAVIIAVLASIWPSIRAALMHPVRALRYE